MANAAPILRPLELADVAAVAAIEAQANPAPWSEELFAGEFDLPPESRLWLVATRGVEIVGFIGLMIVDEHDRIVAHVLNLAVLASLRRTGIASQLLEVALTQAEQRGVDNVTLEVRASNEAAATLYAQFGFATSGTRQRYYQDGEDALILWRSCGGAPITKGRLK